MIAIRGTNLQCGYGFAPQIAIMGGTSAIVGNRCIDIRRPTPSTVRACDSDAGDLVNIQANKCVDVANLATANGSPLHPWECTGASNQKWRRA